MNNVRAHLLEHVGDGLSSNAPRLNGGHLFLHQRPADGDALAHAAGSASRRLIRLVPIPILSPAASASFPPSAITSTFSIMPWSSWSKIWQWRTNLPM